MFTWACLRGIRRLGLVTLFAGALIPLGRPAVAPTASPAPASAARMAAPSPVHTPMVSERQPDDPPGYRAEVIAIADRYTQLYYTANLDGAREEARRGLALAVTQRRSMDEAQFLKAVGYVSWLLGDSATALEHEQRLLDLANRFDDDRLRSIASRVLGSIYRQTGDRALQRRYTEDALRFAERVGDDNLADGALNNLGVMAMESGDLAESRRLHERVLARREATGNRWDAAGSLTNLADVATAEGDLVRALALHERAYALRIEVGDTRGQMRSLRQTAAVLRRLNRADEALARLEAALARTEEITGHELLGDLWREIALTREARGEFAEALAAERRANREREALAGERTQARVAELEARFDLARKEQTIAALDQESKIQRTELLLRESQLERTRIQRLAILGLAAAALCALGAVISRQRLKLAAERRLRDQAEQADRLKTRLLGVASHDLRNPLGNIHFLASDLRRESPAQGGPLDERLDLIVGESQRLLVLVQDLVDTAALEVGRLELRKAPMDLAATVQQVLTEYDWQTRGKRQQVHFAPADSAAGRIVADEARLHQVVSNLVGNAIKFTPAGGQVHLALDRGPQEVTLRVRDGGPGISAEDASRLFTPFTRLGAQPTGGESSHGLGLSIAHELVRLHGGRIAVESTPGAGATFVVTLPV